MTADLAYVLKVTYYQICQSVQHTHTHKAYRGVRIQEDSIDHLFTFCGVG